MSPQSSSDSPRNQIYWMEQNEESEGFSAPVHKNSLLDQRKDVLSRLTQTLPASLTEIIKDCAALKVTIRKWFSAGSERGPNKTDHQATAENSD